MPEHYAPSGSGDLRNAYAFGANNFHHTYLDIPSLTRNIKLRRVEAYQALEGYQHTNADPLPWIRGSSRSSLEDLPVETLPYTPLNPFESSETSQVDLHSVPPVPSFQDFVNAHPVRNGGQRVPLLEEVELADLNNQAELVASTGGPINSDFRPGRRLQKKNKRGSGG